MKGTSNARATLDLAPIGNCSVSALIDREGAFVWACLPRVDGDPMFCRMLDQDGDNGAWALELEGRRQVEQGYVRNTPILRTVMTTAAGDAVEVIDFAPRFRGSGRVYRPMAFVRLVRPLSGSPRIRMRLRPKRHWGAGVAERTVGSNHVRYIGSDVTLRLTSNCAVSHITEERTFRLEKPLAFFLGPDEPFVGEVHNVCQTMADETQSYWQEWVRTLSVPLDWQDVVIRAAITLKLCSYEETGAIVAALTTSIPEHADSGRNWDYRYCWLRDAYYVVRALNRLGAADILENYLGYLRNIVDGAAGGHVQPVYGVGMEAVLAERVIETMPGYRGMGPVRVGNQAHEHLQHDVYGQVILSSVQAFFDARLLRPSTVEDFRALEAVGRRAFELHDQPDAGLWEFRTIARVHTYSALMCWAACDRLSKAAEWLGLPESETWSDRAQTIRLAIDARAFNPEKGSYAGSFGGAEVDASLLQLVDLTFVGPDDPRFTATLARVEQELRRDKHLMRYAAPDDFGKPKTAFNFCTFWLIEALHSVGRTKEAREIFDEMISHRTHAGLLSEDLAIESGELWGNYPQTYSLVGLINCAILLSRPWSAMR